MIKQALTLSIVIPVYNEEDHIKRCLDSIASQTIPPDEVIIVSNNSTDATDAIAATYPFVRLIKEKKQGILSARTTGFNAAKSDIIGRIDADTRLPKDWVKHVKNYYKHNNSAQHALTGGGYFYNIRLPRFNGWVMSQMAYRVNRLVTGHYIVWGSNMALPKSMWLAVRKSVCQRTDIHEDMDLAIHLHRSGYKIVYQAKKLRVGVYLKRVFNGRQDLHAHMRRWPKTLKDHDYQLWWMGSLGNFLLWYVFQPMIFGAEGLARLFGRPRIK